jgi:hypothetical protein
MDIRIKLVYLIVSISIILFANSNSGFAQPEEEESPPVKPMEIIEKEIKASSSASPCPIIQETNNENVGNLNKNVGVSSGGSGGKSFFVSSSDTESPIEIKKFLDPYLKDGYCVSDELGVAVEVKNLGNKKIEGISICERIDDNLDLIRYSNCYLTRFGNKSWMIMNALKKGAESIEPSYIYDNITPIVNDNKTLTINIKYLGPKGRAIYYYKMKPNEEGNFLLGTIVAFKNAEFRDIDYYIENECSNPIKVTATPEKFHLYTLGIFNFLDDYLGRGSSTFITYKLKYKNISDSINDTPLTAKMYTSKEYEIKDITKNGKKISITYNPDGSILFYLNNSEDSEIILEIKFNKDNSYPTPAIYISNTPYPENPQTITVEDYFNSRSNYFTFLLLFILNILILMYTNKSQDKALKQSLRVFSIQMRKITNELKNISSSESESRQKITECDNKLENKINK